MASPIFFVIVLCIPYSAGAVNKENMAASPVREALRVSAAIPCYAWANQGADRMRVWIQEEV
ncbi:hypothetical protein [uncultured Acetatifactor sp.]|uniref:hypothetical protein n=1 Tax=uncultured Acetatifactor sp. TaxID=1671927 RepID=UPI0034DD3FEB